MRFSLPVLKVVLIVDQETKRRRRFVEVQQRQGGGLGQALRVTA